MLAVCWDYVNHKNWKMFHSLIISACIKIALMQHIFVFGGGQLFQDDF